MSLENRVKQHLINEYELSVEDVEDLYGSAKRTVQEGLVALQNDVDAQDFEAVAATAHTLKGNFLNMGLAEIADIARQIEESSRKSLMVETGSCVKELQKKTSSFFKGNF